MGEIEYYNTRVIDYGNGIKQYRFYDKPFFKGSEKEKGREVTRYELIEDIQVNKSTGEIRSKEMIEHSLDTSCKRSLEKVYQYSMSNKWDWFFTLTFNPEKVNSFDYDECLSKVRKWFNNVRSRQALDLKYLVVPEQHKSGRWHFHALVANVGTLKFEDSGHKTHGNTIYNLPQFKWGFTTATAVQDTRKASSYLCKYITKDLCKSTMNKRRYLSSKNLLLPQITEEFIPNSIKQLFVADMAENIQYTKTVEIPYTDNKITYITVRESL